MALVGTKQNLASLGGQAKTEAKPVKIGADETAFFRSERPEASRIQSSAISLDALVDHFPRYGGLHSVVASHGRGESRWRGSLLRSKVPRSPSAIVSGAIGRVILASHGAVYRGLPLEETLRFCILRM